MQSGFNTNIRYRGVLFHVQTEDSGRELPHIITHLYHGGTILASEKRDYAAEVDSPELTQTVRQLMERQHKQMLGRLRKGEFNPVIEQRLGADVFGDPAEHTGGTTQPEAVPSEAIAATEATRPLPPEELPSALDRGGRPFGEGIVTGKPLDEVVLEYLVDNARKRRRTRKPTG